MDELKPGEALLFVYGSLRPGFNGPMAAWLSSVAYRLGAATAGGILYRIDYYPGFVPGLKGRVAGDLFLLPDAAELFPMLDEHEECTPHFPEPHEYRRESLIVDTAAGPVDAWTYVYARNVSGLQRIESGDFVG